MRTSPLVPLLLLVALLATPTPARADEDGDDADDEIGLRWGRWLGAPAPPPTPSCASCPPIAAPSIEQPLAIAAVLAAAYETAGLAQDPAPSFVRRARWSALLPWLSIRGGWNQDWDDATASRTTVGEIGNRRTFEVRATWRLDRLAFDGRELQIASFASARQRERRKLATRVIRVYFAYLRALRGGDALVAAEAAAELDALTDGRFTGAATR